jgi:hypothetical protein
MFGAGTHHTPWDDLPSLGDIFAQFFSFFIIYAGHFVDAKVTNLRAALAPLSELIVHDLTPFKNLLSI